MKKNIRIKRVYDPVTSDDGARVLVDRVWPRGISKEVAELTLWLKDIAPTTQLRKWFGHDPSRWQSFGGDTISSWTRIMKPSSFVRS